MKQAIGCTCSLQTRAHTHVNVISVQSLTIYAISFAYHTVCATSSIFFNLVMVVHEVVVTDRSSTVSWLNHLQCAEEIIRRNTLFRRTVGSSICNSNPFKAARRPMILFNEVISLWATENLHHIIWLVDTFVFVHKPLPPPANIRRCIHSVGLLKKNEKENNLKESKITGKWLLLAKSLELCTRNSHKRSRHTWREYERQQVPHTEHGEQ